MDLQNKIYKRDIDVICIGQAVVDCITRYSEADLSSASMMADAISLSIGGDAVNEARILAVNGHQVELMCGLGRDLAGDLLLKEVKRVGVGTGMVTVSDHLRTPIANLLVRSDGSRKSFNSTATKLVGYVPGHETVKGASVVSLASLFRAPLHDPKQVLKLARAAKEDGAVLVADTKLPTFYACSLDQFAEVLTLIDVIFPNAAEAEHYTGKHAYKEMAETFHAYGIPHVIIKAGADGCYASDHGSGVHISPAPVEVIDTTGAGDSFVAGFISQLLQHGDFRSCCDAGMRSAAHCITHMGALDAS